MKIEEFNKLSKAEQRVEVAKDARRQVKSGVYTPQTSCFVDLRFYNSPKQGAAFHKALTRSNILECEVCALGALMVSSIRKKNNVQYDPFNAPNPDSGIFSTNLKALFSKSQRILIENAFELGGGYYAHSGERVSSIAVQFGKKFPDSTSRLIGILDNIIANNGTFKP